MRFRRKPDRAHIAQLEAEIGDISAANTIARIDAELEKGKPKRRELFVPPDLSEIKSGPVLTHYATSLSSFSAAPGARWIVNEPDAIRVMNNAVAFMRDDLTSIAK